MNVYCEYITQMLGLQLRTPVDLHLPSRVCKSPRRPMHCVPCHIGRVSGQDNMKGNLHVRLFIYLFIYL